MKYALKILLLLFTASCGGPKSRSQLNIIGGTSMQANDPMLKSMVALVDRNGNILCTGVVIAPQSFLTAAHCVVFSQAVSVRVGLDVSSIRSLTKIKDWKMHEEFKYEELTKKNPTNKIADIAIVHTVDPLVGLTPAAIVNADAAIQIGSEMRISGFGRSVGDLRESSGIALYWDFLVASANQVTREFLLTDPDFHSACHGDSGGPVYAMIDGKFVVAGLVSRGLASCESNESIVTDLRSYAGWISSHLQEKN